MDKYTLYLKNKIINNNINLETKLTELANSIAIIAISQAIDFSIGTLSETNDKLIFNINGQELVLMRDLNDEKCEEIFKQLEPIVWSN